MNTTSNNNETKKTTRKSIKVTVDDGVKYFVIYEVHAKKLIDGEVITTDRFLNKKDAEQKIDFNDRYMKELYEFSYIYEQWVWC